MATEFSPYMVHRRHNIVSIPGDLFDRSPRFAVLSHYVEPVPCGSWRSLLGAKGEVDRCISGDKPCSVGVEEQGAPVPPRARVEVA